MKVLNLVDRKASQIGYQVSSFPDGQRQIKIFVEDVRHHDCERKGYYRINARLNNFQDLELIICATKSLKNLGVKNVNLYVPYFLGSRSDRKFEYGSNNYLKEVICPIINSLDFETVTVLDPHSFSLECCLNNFKSISNLELVEFALNDIFNKNTK